MIITELQFIKQLIEFNLFLNIYGKLLLKVLENIIRKI